MPHVSAGRRRGRPGTFTPGAGHHVLVGDDLTARARRRATTSSAGWPRRAGSPLGYLGDAAKTARTFPVDRRRALLGARRPGPAARRRHASSCTAATRSRSTPAARRSSPRRSRRRSATIPACTTCVVAGRPSERWGNEVVAVVQLRDGVAPSTDEPSCSPRPSSTSPATSCPRRSSSSTRSCARPSGKADYRWARTTAAG